MARRFAGLLALYAGTVVLAWIALVTAETCWAQGTVTGGATPNITTSIESGEPLIVDIRVVGNRNRSTEKVLKEIGSRKGRNFDQNLFEKDTRKLVGKGWFLDVRPNRQEVPGGVVLTFEVVERPTLAYVKYLGNKKVKLRNLIKETELKKGGPLDPYAIEEGRRKLEELYKRKGFNNAQVSIMEGTKPTDQGAIYLINEGPVQKVWKVNFVGNSFVSGSRLYTQIESKKPLLYIFKGYVDRKKIDEDIEKLTAYYHGFGYFRARVGRELEFNEEQNWLTLTFVIDEGPRCIVDSVEIKGNKKFASEQFAPLMQLKSGAYFDASRMGKDVGTIKDVYGSDGHIFCDVNANPRIAEDPGHCHVVYDISEGDRYRVGNINVKIEGDNPHTKRQAVLNRISLRPGDIVDIREIRSSERRLKASSLFLNDPTKGSVPKITFTPPDAPADGEGGEKSGERVARGGHRRVRGQSPDPEPGVRYIDISADADFRDAAAAQAAANEAPTIAPRTAPQPQLRVVSPASATTMAPAWNGAANRSATMQSTTQAPTHAMRAPANLPTVAARPISAARPTHGQQLPGQAPLIDWDGSPIYLDKQWYEQPALRAAWQATQ